MSVLRIPLVVDPPAYSMAVELEGTVYGIQIRYNARSAAWYMDLLFNGAIVANAIKLVEGVNLLRRLDYMKADGRLPPGTWRVYDTSAQHRDPTRTNLGTDVVLLYDEAG